MLNMNLINIFRKAKKVIISYLDERLPEKIIDIIVIFFLLTLFIIAFYFLFNAFIEIILFLILLILIMIYRKL